MGKKPLPIQKKSSIKQQMEEEQVKKHESQVEEQQKQQKNPMMKQFEKMMSEMVEEQNQKIEKHEGRLGQLEAEKNALDKLVGVQADKMTKLEKEQAQLRGENNALKKQVNEQREEIAKLHGWLQEKEQLMKVQVEKLERIEKLRIEEQKMRLSAEFSYAHLIGFPTVTNLEGNYNRTKFLDLIKRGNAITAHLYIQSKQKLVDDGITKSIVNLLATTKKPENLVGKVIIEDYHDWFKWPQNGELKLKRKTAKVAVEYNGASAKPTILSDLSLAEYELVNNGCLFEVVIYYESEEHFNKAFLKFAYRRLP